MWFVYAFAAAVLWGLCYAASGRVIERGMTPLSFFFLYASFGALAGALALAGTARLHGLLAEFRGLGEDWVWFVVAVVCAVLGNLLIYMAIGEKNATLASLIEISYPLFVACFAWLLFREVQFNALTLVGAGLILGGVATVWLANR